MKSTPPKIGYEKQVVFRRSEPSVFGRNATAGGLRGVFCFDHCVRPKDVAIAMTLSVPLYYVGNTRW